MLHRFLTAVAWLLLACSAVRAQVCVDYQPNEMEILDTLTLQGMYAYEVVIEGEVAYVGTAYALHTVDISDPGTLLLLGSIPYNGLNLAVSDQLVCLATQDDDLHFIDASDPANMNHVKTITDLEGLQNVIAHGDYFYAGANHLGVYTVDASDPANPVLSFAVDVDERVVDLAAAGNLLYTIGYDSDLCVFDLTDPAQPALLSVGNTYGNGGWDILLNGSYLYLASMSRGVTVMNVSNPNFPSRVGTTSVQGSVFSLARVGDTLFAGYDPTLQAFDISNPAVPVQIGRMIANLEVWGLVAHGENLIGVAADHVLFSLEVSQPVSTLPLANHNTGSDARNIIFDGFYGFVADGIHGLYIRSAASAAPVSVTALPGYLQNVTIDGDLAYLALDDLGIQIADISDVSHPVLLDDINTSGHAQDVAVYHNDSGTYALVADTEYDLASYDATDPTYIRPRGITYFPGRVHDIEVHGDHALVADNSGRLQVVDVSFFPDPPQIAATLEVPGSPMDLLVQDDVVYVSGGRYLNTVDISDPLVPQLLGTLETSWQILDVAVKDGVAYCSQATTGMLIVDVSDPTQMQILADFRTLGNPAGITVHESTVYLCVGDDGLVLLPLQCLLSPVGDQVPGQASGYLGQAYPNPFNPLTTIGYVLPRDTTVDLDVYDLAGRRVRTLVAGRFQNAGPHQAQWDGKDEGGRAAPAGVYLYRLTAEGINETRRAVLVK